MQKIYFDYLPSWINYLLISLAVLFFTIHLIVFFNESYTRLTNVSAVLGYAFLVLCLGKMFVSKNYAGWNNRGIYLRLGYFKGNNMRFSSIRHIDFTKSYRKRALIYLPGSGFVQFLGLNLKKMDNLSVFITILVFLPEKSGN